MRKNTYRSLVWTFVLCLIVGISTAHAETPNLSKKEAAQILSFMGRKNVKVGAVIKGLGITGIATLSSDSVALVLAVGISKGKSQKTDYTFFYDEDLGWFYYESVRSDLTSQYEIRIWTKDGFKRIEHPKLEE